MIDILKLARGLQKVGMTAEQSESVAEALNDAQTDYVSKSDLEAAVSRLEARLPIQNSRCSGALASLWRCR
jgi:hypothetical protein